MTEFVSYSDIRVGDIVQTVEMGYLGLVAESKPDHEMRDDFLMLYDIDFIALAVIGDWLQCVDETNRSWYYACDVRRIYRPGEDDEQG